MGELGREVKRRLGGTGSARGGLSVQIAEGFEASTQGLGAVGSGARRTHSDDDADDGNGQDDDDFERACVFECASRLPSAAASRLRDDRASVPPQSPSGSPQRGTPDQARPLDPHGTAAPAPGGAPPGSPPVSVPASPMRTPKLCARAARPRVVRRYVLVVEEEAAADEGLMELLQQLVCCPAAAAGLATHACAQGVAGVLDQEVRVRTWRFRCCCACLVGRVPLRASCVWRCLMVMGCVGGIVRVCLRCMRTPMHTPTRTL